VVDGHEVVIFPERPVELAGLPARNNASIIRKQIVGLVNVRSGSERTGRLQERQHAREDVVIGAELAKRIQINFIGLDISRCQSCRALQDFGSILSRNVSDFVILGGHKHPLDTFSIQRGINLVLETRAPLRTYAIESAIPGQDFQGNESCLAPLSTNGADIDMIIVVSILENRK